MSVLSEGGGDGVSRSRWVGDGMIIGMDEIGIQGCEEVEEGVCGWR